MSYCFTVTLAQVSFNDAVAKVTAELQKEGFGVLTDIDVQSTLKKKLDKDIKQYRILGACNPPFAYKSLTAESKIGVFLPCNVVVEENEDGTVDVSAVDPIASMMAVGNPALEEIATEVQLKLKRVVGNL